MARGFRWAWPAATGRPRRLPRVVASWPRERSGRLAAEIVLALAAGVAAFVVAAVVATVARGDVPTVLFGLLLLLAVLAVFRLAGIRYALPVGLAIVLAFGWYFPRPPRELDPATALVLGLFLVMAVVAGAFTAEASRRAAGSEEARGALAGEQAALRRVATLVARQGSSAEVFAAVTEETARTARLLRLDSVHLVVYEPDRTATVVGSWNLRGPPLPVGERVPLEGDNIIGRVFRTRQPARIDDYAGASGPVAQQVRSTGIRAAVGVPVLVGGRLWGVMAVGSSRPEPLPADTEMRIGAFTELVATAIGNTAARAELEQVAAEQAALRRVATLVAEAAAPGDVFTAVSAEVAGQFGVPLVGLFRYEQEGDPTVIGGAGKLASYRGRRWPCPAGDPGLVASLQRTGQPLRIDDYAQIKSAISGRARELGIGMAAGVPVFVGGRAWGAMVVAAGYENPPLPPDTLDRLAAFTELMATAIANSDARAEMERLAHEQAALRRVATLVARGAETSEIFAAVAREVAKVMHLPVAAVQRYDDDETMTMLASYSDRPHPFHTGTRWPVHRSGLAARVRQTARAGGAAEYANRRGAFAAAARELGLHSVAGAPIIVDGAVWGLMTIASTEGPIPDYVWDRLADFTELLGTAIANTQSRAELTASRARIVAAADETRRRLERDLHDGIQQRLVALGLKAQRIKTMTPRPADSIQGELSLLADGLFTSLHELQEISRGIHPAVLSEAGLGPALKALARRSAVPVELDLDLGSPLGQQVEVAAYYIASEALANAAKHAQASVVDLRVQSGDNALTLSIRDDGVGGADPSRGSGITGLRDRVEALGGTISVLSPPGHGTTLHVRLPAARARDLPI
jgi:signal transduction histidine kinase